MAYMFEKYEGDSSRPYLAVASSDGAKIDLHLGQAAALRIYKSGTAEPELLETREMPPPGKGLGRWMQMAELLKDCGMLLVNGIGETPLVMLSNKGLKIYVVESSVKEAFELAFRSGDLSSVAKYKDGGGCGASRGSSGCFGA